MSFQVCVVEYDTKKVVKQFAATTMRDAEKLERGISINLDYLRFYTEIRDKSPRRKASK